MLVFANVAVFYDLYNHLAMLGIPGEVRGFLIGIFSLVTIPLFMFGGPFVNHRNAPGLMLLGMAVLTASGIAYLLVHSFWGLLVLRVINGMGMFCLSASSLALLVWVIPEDKSGQGFAIYSSAILIPYALMPAIMDALAPWLPSSAHGYAGMSILFLPAAAVVLLIMRRRRRAAAGDPEESRLPSWPEIKRNLARLPIVVMLAANGIYFMNFSGLFFLFKGFAQQIHLGNVGKFFTVQMIIMLVIRTFGSGIFDRLSKVLLLNLAFGMAAAGHLALACWPGTGMSVAAAVVFGLGLALGYPALNALMYLHSDTRLRAMNANLMMMALQAGYFVGPLVGGAVVAQAGYEAFFLVWMGLNLIGLIGCALLLRTPVALISKK
eukprot:TRINITY_DN16417_c0_g1_i1.p1 TRINITY_DN16417_c0_g1~~TRINITY_DN16417_c0_g1_i1.p1  ORF type:complete len:379 (+),score=148.56 TRINITY_DN16417_c0_g1_i1:1084-2220(+)